MKTKEKLSMVLPAYNESGNIEMAARQLEALCCREELDYELIFVNDGSKDTTWEEICEVSKNNPHIKGICFSRNFGKEAAVTAGLECASGDGVVVMDCDLQHPPDVIPSMIQLWRQGYEIIEGVKTNRGKESGWHRIAADGFYRILSQAMGMDMKNASDFKLLDRKVVDVIRSIPEKSRFFRELSTWVGFRSATVNFEVQERMNGSSKWSTGALIGYAIGNLAVCTCLPMQFATICGGLSLFAAMIVCIFMVVQMIQRMAVDYMEMILFCILLIGGMILVGLGIVGYYIGKIYNEVRGRPSYIVSSKTK